MNNKIKSKEGKYGQFFTDIIMCDEVLEIVNSIKPIGGAILEPSFGTGNFIESLMKYNFDVVDGVEVDTEKFNGYKNDRVNLYNDDFLLHEFKRKYDFIIGNPPYIEVCYSFYDSIRQEEVKKKYSGLSNGRLNLVHAFMKDSMENLNDDGIIAYLLPSSVLTSPIYKGVRESIYNNFDVVYLKEDVSFSGVAIKVSLLIIRKTENTGKYFFISNGNYFIMSDYEKFIGTKTLKDFGFDVSVGDVIWNNKKDILSKNSTNNNILLYSSNIKYDGIILENNKRLQYIDSDNITHKTGIVFPRTVSKKVKFFYIENNDKYLFENHTLVLINKDKSLLDKFYLRLKSGFYNELLNSFFNSSNLTKGELLSLPFE